MTTWVGQCRCVHVTHSLEPLGNCSVVEHKPLASLPTCLPPHCTLVAAQSLISISKITPYVQITTEKFGFVWNKKNERDMQRIWPPPPSRDLSYYQPHRHGRIPSNENATQPTRSSSFITKQSQLDTSVDNTLSPCRTTHSHSHLYKNISVDILHAQNISPNFACTPHSTTPLWK